MLGDEPHDRKGSPVLQDGSAKIKTGQDSPDDMRRNLLFLVIGKPLRYLVAAVKKPAGDIDALFLVFVNPSELSYLMFWGVPFPFPFLSSRRAGGRASRYIVSSSCRVVLEDGGIQTFFFFFWVRPRFRGRGKKKMPPPHTYAGRKGA